MSAAKAPSAHGILLVDKARGGTSHDVVGHARKALGQREVGHAGTLDPMATGLLVVLLGEGTKLALYLTAADKAYVTTVRFGEATDSLDADGKLTETSAVPELSHAVLEEALAALRGPQQQVPPAVSAIKVAGVPLHERVRRGELVVPEARSVSLLSARIVAVREREVDLELECSKGFYVRSLARDLAERLGTVGHLTALRRTRSGRFSVDEAVSATLLRSAREGNEEARKELRARVLPLRAAERAMPLLTVNAVDAKELRQGKKPATTFAGEEKSPVLVFDEEGQAVCLASVNEGHLEVLRGFVPLN